MERTDEEWAAVISNTITKLDAAGDAAVSDAWYRGPDPGTAFFAWYIDHTLLKPEATDDAVRAICKEARTWKFRTVCVRSHHVAVAVEALRGSDVQVCSVVCFPQGTQSTVEKINEGAHAITAGAAELDFVINWPLLLAHSYAAVYKELLALRDAFRTPRRFLKLILETSQLSRVDIVAGCLLASAADFGFVKTSTGFVGSGARVEDVRLMRRIAVLEGKRMQVKASGGIRTAADAKAMLEAGATRLGLSGSVAIMVEGKGGVGAEAEAAANGADGGY